MSFSHGRQRLATRFRLFLAPFLQSDSLPFAQVLGEQQIEEAAQSTGVNFGQSERDIFTPAITLWAFLTQVMHAKNLRSCAAAVRRVVVLLNALGRKVCSRDTAAYCRARAKLPEAMLQKLTLDVGHQLEAAAPADWLWCGRHVKLVDGTTVSMPDTDANQQVYPQPSSQEPGLGFPMAGMTGLLSLGTGALCGLAMGPRQGKETGETAQLRSMLDQLNGGDVLLGDRADGNQIN